MRGGARGDKYPEDLSGLLMELADMSALEADAVKSVGVRIPPTLPSLIFVTEKSGSSNPHDEWHGCPQTVTTHQVSWDVSVNGSTYRLHR